MNLNQWGVRRHTRLPGSVLGGKIPAAISQFSSVSFMDNLMLALKIDLGA
jgi:hypothetical protein